PAAVTAAPLPAGVAATAPVAAAPLAIAPSQPVAMNQLFRSPTAVTPASPAAAAKTPEQTFLAQKALFQRQMTNARGGAATPLNSRPAPRGLSSNLMPVLPGGPKLGSPSAMPSIAPAGGAGAPAGAAGAASGATPGPDGSPIAQKMLDGLAKYEQLKKQ